MAGFDRLRGSILAGISFSCGLDQEKDDAIRFIIGELPTHFDKSRFWNLLAWGRVGQRGGISDFDPSPRQGSTLKRRCRRLSGARGALQRRKCPQKNCLVASSLDGALAVKEIEVDHGCGRLAGI